MGFILPTCMDGEVQMRVNKETSQIYALENKYDKLLCKKCSQIHTC